MLVWNRAGKKSLGCFDRASVATWHLTVLFVNSDMMEYLNTTGAGKHLAQDDTDAPKALGGQ